MKTKILLIGSNGQIGRETAELAAKNDIDLMSYDLDRCDITDYSQVASIFKQCLDKGFDADAVINASGYTAVDKAEDEPDKAFAVNYAGVQNLAIICKKFNWPLIHISTDYVFSGENEYPYKETDTTKPLGVYGKSKLAGEEALIQTWEKHIILRVSWVFGNYGNNFVKTILQAAKKQEVLNVVSDQRGCPTAATNIGRVMLELSQKLRIGIQNWGIYHYCDYPVTTWYDLACKIVELGRKKYSLRVKQINKITTAEYATRAKRPLNSELSAQKILDVYGIVRRGWLSDLKDVIEKMDIP